MWPKFTFVLGAVCAHPPPSPVSFTKRGPSKGPYLGQNNGNSHLYLAPRVRAPPFPPFQCWVCFVAPPGRATEDKKKAGSNRPCIFYKNVCAHSSMRRLLLTRARTNDCDPGCGPFTDPPLDPLGPN